MQQVSRKLLLAGVLAFGTLTAACGDKVQLTQVDAVKGVQSVSVSPQNASINVGTTITLAASVTADAATDKSVSWTTSNSAVATVDQSGKVTGISAGTVTVIATAKADASKSAGAAIVVNANAVPILVQPSIAINSVTDVNGNPVNLGNTNGQVNVAVNTSGGGLIEVFLSTSCTTNTISSTDVAVASQQATSAQAGTVTLSFNTAQLTASNQARFANGNYCIKARLTNGKDVVVATNTTPITLNNTNVFRATLAFTSQTGGPTSAVSTTNGFNYNQGTLTASLSSTVFTSSAPVAGISGYLTRNGEQASAGVPTGSVGFTNATVTNGVATVVFTDTGNVNGVRSIFLYNSLPAGDTLYITSATDASGNSIPVTSTGGGFAVAGGSGVRIDNDTPTLAGAYTVTAPNGYVGAAYAFSSGTSGTASTDTHITVPGVGGVTTTYYVGAAGSTAFTTANSCDVTGLTAASTGSSLANTTATNADQAKVVVADALGNKVCKDVASTFAGGLFGVDKIAPSLAFGPSSTSQTSTRSVAANTGYNTTTKNFVFVFSDTISGFNPNAPLRGTLVRNFFTSGLAGDCVIGGYDPVAKTCLNNLMAGTVSLTGGTNVVGYYTITANSEDQAGNKSAVVTRTAAFDNVAPTAGAITQSPAAVDPLGTVTVSASAADNFALTTTRGNLTYATAPAAFARVAGNVLGAFGTQVTSGTATVALPNVYRGLQSTDVANTILANTATPSATITVSDVGRNTVTAGPTTVATSSAATNALAVNGNKFQLISSAADGTTAASVATTDLTARVTGLSSDAAFQSQPFAQIDFYQVDANGELKLIGTNTLASVTDNGSGVRTYNYKNSNVPLNGNAGSSVAAGDPAVTNVFYAVGRTSAGDAVITQSQTQTQPAFTP